MTYMVQLVLIAIEFASDKLSAIAMSPIFVMCRIRSISAV